MGMLARLGVVLGLDSAEFQQGLERADKQLSKFIDKIPTVGAVGAAAFTAMTYEAMKFADELSDTAKANDMAVSSILKLQEALQQSGGDAENAGKMLNSFTNFVDKAASGNGDAQKSFAKLGISLKDIAKLSNEELFGKALESLSQIDDTVTRNAKAFDMFGKAAKGVDFRSLNDEIQHGTGLSEEWTKSIMDAGDAWDMLGKKHHEFVTQFTAGMGSTLKMTMEYFDQVFEKNNFVFEAVKTVFQKIAVVGANVAFVIKGIADEIEHTIQNAKLIATLDIEGAKRANAEYAQRKEEDRKRLDAFQNRVMSTAPAENTSPNTPSGGGNRRTVEASAEAKKIEQMLAMARLISGEYERHLQFNLANLKTQGEMAGMSENQRKIQEAINKVADETDKKLDEIQKKKEEAAAHGADKSVIAELDNQAEAVKMLGKDYEKLTEDEIQGQIDSQNTFEFGWNKAFAQYAEDSQNAAKLGQGYFQTMTGAMSNAIDTFVQTGKFSFKDFATSIIKDLIAMEMKFQAMQLLRMAILSFRTPTPHADGGFTGANTPYLVGERGPELFVPQGSGTIIPNNRLPMGQNNAPQVVYNGPYIANMNAIDTQSATQFLVKNKQAVFAANQSATRSIPASR